MTEEETERTSPPELRNLPDNFWDGAVAGWPVGKEPISIRVDQDVLDWFRQTGPRDQSRMNAVLRSDMTRRQQADAENEPARRKRRIAWRKNLGLTDDCEVDDGGVFDRARCVEQFQRDQVALGIVVEDDARAVLIALGDRGVPKDHRECVGLSVVAHSHGCLQYFARRLVR